MIVKRRKLMEWRMSKEESMRQQFSPTLSVGSLLNDSGWLIFLWCCLFSGQETISQENLLSALTFLATVYALIFLGECDRRLLISPHPALNGHQSKWTCSLDDKELLAPATMTASLYCNHSVSFSCYADCELWDCLCAFSTRGWYFSAHLLKMSKKNVEMHSPHVLFSVKISQLGRQILIQEWSLMKQIE